MNDTGVGVQSMKWFRFYHEALHDPKVLKLSDKDFRHWVNVLCIASLNGNRGELPSVDDIALHLRVRPPQAQRILTRLAETGMLDETPTGYRPHNWEGRQSRSDDEAAKKRKQRGLSRDNDGTSPDDVPPLARASAPASESDQIRSERESESLDDDPPDVREISLAVLQCLSPKYQADPATFSEARQMGWDFRGKHREVQEAIAACRRENQGPPFPQRIRKHLDSSITPACREQGCNNAPRVTGWCFYHDPTIIRMPEGSTS